MRGKLFAVIGMICFTVAIWPSEEIQAKVEEGEELSHNWEESSTSEDIIHADSHEYTYWKNFLRVTRTCDISHRVTTTVYYCDVHDHTKSETNLEEVMHSGKHR
ncbi:hypothetical protein ACFOGI_16700 [Virgibacillus xinjiangensis]|uniref:Uncharacterized protein n=1 Tax=Virgibacillus xinjiangensis TaxID=393090 RepID=A0ABV7CZC9_9BACI